MKEGGIVKYIGSNDDWNHECCKGIEYRIIKEHAPVRGIYYYDLQAVEPPTFLDDDYYLFLNSVRDYQIQTQCRIYFKPSKRIDSKR